MYFTGQKLFEFFQSAPVSFHMNFLDGSLLLIRSFDLHWNTLFFCDPDQVFNGQQRKHAHHVHNTK